MHLPQFARTERRGQPAVLQGADPNDTIPTAANGTPRASASAVRVRMSFSRMSRIIAKVVLHSEKEPRHHPRWRKGGPWTSAMALCVEAEKRK